MGGGVGVHTGPPSPMLELRVAITISQQASSTALPAKQRPLTTPCIRVTRALDTHIELATEQQSPKSE